MKKLLSALVLSCGISTMTAQAADWTPVFGDWVGDRIRCNGNGVLPIIQNLSTLGTFQTTKLSYNAMMGNYQGVPQPYRDDLLPAYALDNEYYSREKAFVFPLQNAKVYGVPLQNFSYEDGENMMTVTLNFGVLSDQDERHLSKILTNGDFDKETYIYRVQVGNPGYYDTADILHGDQNEVKLACYSYYSTE